MGLAVDKRHRRADRLVRELERQVPPEESEDDSVRSELRKADDAN